MSKERIFFQDFLFEDLPVDKQDYPIVKINRLPDNFDKSNCVILSLDKLLRMNNKNEWDIVFGSTRGKIACIYDDVVLENEELSEHKDFYIKTYIFNIGLHSKVCYLM